MQQEILWVGRVHNNKNISGAFRWEQQTGHVCFVYSTMTPASVLISKSPWISLSFQIDISLFGVFYMFDLCFNLYSSLNTSPAVSSHGLNQTSSRALNCRNCTNAATDSDIGVQPLPIISGEYPGFSAGLK